MIEATPVSATTAATHRKPSSWSLLLGLVLGLAIGLSVGYLAGRSHHVDPWIDAGAAWIRLPQQSPMGQAPLAFTVPAKAYDYGAETKPLSPLVSDVPSILRVDLQVSAGTVGVSLAKPDGSALMSKEASVTAAKGATSVYFRISPTMGATGLLLRNYGAEGVAGSGTVTRVAFAPLAKLSDKEIAAANRAGVF